MVQRKRNNTRYSTRFVPIMAVLLLLLALPAGCGRGDEEDVSGEEAASDRNVVATMPAARFDQPTPVTDLQEASEADKQEDEEDEEEAPDIASRRVCLRQTLRRVPRRRRFRNRSGVISRRADLGRRRVRRSDTHRRRTWARSPVRLYKDQPGRTQCGLRLFDITRVNIFL